ncbi:MAG: hypothetical protein H6641_15065 [Caldilineaceae bacterium]|nr:hypothetical protein [Caldilineaceae bacterium]
MMGDGVNDVLSLAGFAGDCHAVGQQRYANVADMVLLNDLFEALRPAFSEGRRIIAGMSSALYLFLARSTTTTLLIIAVTMIGLNFPFDPAQVALTTFTVGIPAFFLTLWAKPRVIEGDILSSLARFVIPVALLTMLLGVGVYLFDYNGAKNAATDSSLPRKSLQAYLDYTGVTLDDANLGETVGTVSAQGALSTFISYTAFMLLLFLEPPFPFFTGWRKKVSSDKRPAWLALILFGVFQIIYFIPALGFYFGILRKPMFVTVGLILLAVVWMFLIRAIWRYHLFERFLGMTIPAE